MVTLMDQMVKALANAAHKALPKMYLNQKMWELGLKKLPDEFKIVDGNKFYKGNAVVIIGEVDGRMKTLNEPVVVKQITNDLSIFNKVITKI